MVSETTEGIDKFFETMAENCRKAGETMLGTQKAWACGDAGKGTAVADMLSGPGSRFATELSPLIAKNVQTATDCVEASVRTGFDVFKTACEVGTKAADADVHDRTRRVFDAAFEGMRNNFDAMETAGKRTAEQWSAFCSTTCREPEATKAGSKASK